MASSLKLFLCKNKKEKDIFQMVVDIVVALLCIFLISFFIFKKIKSLRNGNKCKSSKKDCDSCGGCIFNRERK